MQQLSPEPCLCRITFIQGTHNTKQHFIKQNIRTLLFNAKHITFISLESILNSSLCCCCCCCCCFSFCCYCFQGFSFHLLVSFFQATSLRARLYVEPKGGDTAVVLSNFYRVRTATLPHTPNIKIISKYQNMQISGESSGFDQHLWSLHCNITPHTLKTKNIKISEYANI